MALWLIAGIVISWPLWGAERSFPHLPPLPFLPTLPGPTEHVLAGGLLAALIFTVIKGPAFPVALPAVAVALALAALDQMRWQPWFYQGIALFLTITVLPGRHPSESRRGLALETCRLIMASMYLWSGVQKLTPDFAISYAWFLRPFTDHLASDVQSLLASTAYLSAWVEALTGILLLFGPTRRIGAVLAIATHIFILVLLGPLGHGWNIVVWPWNAASIFLVLVLFGVPGQTLLPSRLTIGAIPAFLVAMLFVAFPFLSLVGRWDCYLSFCLYSLNTTFFDLYVKPDVLTSTSPDALKYSRLVYRHMAVNSNAWAFDTMNVPVYPEPRIGEAIARHFCVRAERDDDVIVDIVGKADLFGRRPPATRLDCSSLRR